jgi:hypothetical protein
MSAEFVGVKKRSPLKGAPTIVRPEAWFPAIVGSSVGANRSGRRPIRSSDPKRAPAVIYPLIRAHPERTGAAASSLDPSQ